MLLHAIIIGEKARETGHYVNSVHAIQGKG